MVVWTRQGDCAPVPSPALQARMVHSHSQLRDVLAQAHTDKRPVFGHGSGYCVTRSHVWTGNWTVPKFHGSRGWLYMLTELGKQMPATRTPTPSLPRKKLLPAVIWQSHAEMTEVGRQKQTREIEEDQGCKAAFRSVQSLRCKLPWLFWPFQRGGESSATHQKQFTLSWE